MPQLAQQEGHQAAQAERVDHLDEGIGIRSQSDVFYALEMSASVFFQTIRINPWNKSKRIHIKAHVPSSPPLLGTTSDPHHLVRGCEVLEAIERYDRIRLSASHHGHQDIQQTAARIMGTGGRSCRGGRHSIRDGSR